MTSRIVVATIGLVAICHAALAQGIDYTAAEQMFGEPVTMSVTGKPQRVSEAPANMTIVTADEIRHSGATNLVDVLQFIPELDVRRYGQLNAAIAIRGYNTALNPRVLVLLNCRQVYQDDYGFVPWSIIPVAMTEIRQVEIVRGPAAALYGFNAVSGVINIVTFDPLTDPIKGGQIVLGTQSTAYGEAVATIRSGDRAGLRLSARGFRATEFSGSESGAMRTAPRAGTLSADGRIRIDTGIEWDLSASIGTSQSDQFIDLGAYEPVAFHSNSLRSRWSADTRAGVLELDIYRNENRAALTSQQAPFSWRQDVTVIRASDLLKLGTAHVVRVAGEWRDNSISSLNAFNGRLGYQIVAGSLMWDWQISPSLSLTNAARIDTLSLSHTGSQFFIPGTSGLYRDRIITQPSFNSGLVLKLSENDTLRFSVARALQLPSLVDFGLGAGTQYGLFIAGNVGLRPAALTNVEIDYDHTLPEMNAKVRVALFGQRTDTTIGSPFGSGAAVLPTGQILLAARNFGSSREIGGEIGIKGETAGIRWNASYAAAVIKDDTPEAILASAPSVSYQRQTPIHSVILGAGKTWGKFDLNGQLRWQSHYQDFRTDLYNLVVTTVTVPNYVTANISGSYRLTGAATLFLTGNQALEHQLIETAGLRVERRLLLGLRVQL